MKSERVAKFNEIIGKAPSADPTMLLQQIANQARILLEEVQETIDAAEQGDWVEVLDGGLDIKFVASEIQTQLESIGIWFTPAFMKVCDNNDEKWTTSGVLATEWFDYHRTNDVECHIKSTDIEGVTYYCVRRNSDNKVLKWDGFPKVDLTDFIPRDLLPKGE